MCACYAAAEEIELVAHTPRMRSRSGECEQWFRQPAGRRRDAAAELRHRMDYAREIRV